MCSLAFIGQVDSLQLDGMNQLEYYDSKQGAYTTIPTNRLLAWLITVPRSAVVMGVCEMWPRTGTPLTAMLVKCAKNNSVTISCSIASVLMKQNVKVNTK